MAVSEPSKAARDAALEVFDAIGFVAGATAPDVIQRAIDKAVAAERERCAKVAALWRRWGSKTASGHIADMIRALPEMPDEAQISHYVTAEDEGVCQITPAKVDDSRSDVEHGDDDY